MACREGACSRCRRAYAAGHSPLLTLLLFALPRRSARAKNDNFEEGLLKLVRTLPKVLKFLPSDKAQDARNFVQALQYWLGGNSENLQVGGCGTWCTSPAAVQPGAYTSFVQIVNRG
jgi:hypothetical protein